MGIRGFLIILMVCVLYAAAAGPCDHIKFDFKFGKGTHCFFEDPNKENSIYLPKVYGPPWRTWRLDKRGADEYCKLYNARLPIFFKNPGLLKFFVDTLKKDSKRNNIDYIPVGLTITGNAVSKDGPVNITWDNGKSEQLGAGTWHNGSRGIKQADPYTVLWIDNGRYKLTTALLYTYNYYSSWNAHVFCHFDSANPVMTPTATAKTTTRLTKPTSTSSTTKSTTLTPTTSTPITSKSTTTPTTTPTPTTASTTVPEVTTSTPSPNTTTPSSTPPTTPKKGGSATNIGSLMITLVTSIVAMIIANK